MKPESSHDSAALRRAAEARLNEAKTDCPPPTEGDLRRFQHELEVHEVELEMQNENLCAALERYTEHFDFAPVGFLNLTTKGVIKLVNPMGAKLIGIERDRLVGQPFASHLAAADRPAFNQFLSGIFVTKATDSCEITLGPPGLSARCCLLEATRSPDGRECRAVLIDITERKRAEQALREAEERHRGLVESAFDGSVIHQDGSIIVASGTYAKMFGYTVDELIGKPVVALTAPEVRDAVADITRRHDAAPYETVGLRKDGSHFAIEVAGRICTHRGQSARIAAVRDITTRKQMEEEVGRKNRFLSLLHQLSPSLSKLTSSADIPERISTLIGQVFDNRNLSIAWYDEATGRVSFPIYRIAGESRDNLVQRPLGNGLTEYVIRTRTPLLISDRMDEAMAERGIAPIGTPSRCYLGAPMLMGERVIGVIAVQDYGQANVYDGSHVELLATIAADAAVAYSNARLLEGTRKELRERRQAEAALRASEERWRFALEGAGDGVWDWNIPTGEVVFSKQWKAMLGFSDSDIGSGLDEWSKRVHPDDLPQAMADVKAHLAGQTATYANEHRVSCKDGSWRWVLDRGMVMGRGAEGQPLRMIGTHTDITDRVRQQQVVQDLLAQTEQDARTKGELLREVNHRVTNNLTAVLGLLVHEKESAGGSERSLVAPVLDRLQQRIRGLLQVHRMLAQSAWAPVGVDKLAQEIIRGALSVAPWRHQAVVTIKPSALKVSPRQAGGLALVLNELTTNTVKYGGQPPHSVAISLEAERHEEWATICYRDNGPGYPVEVLAGQRANVGLKLINEIVTKTLRGSLVLANDQGAVAVIRVQLEDENRT